MSEPILEQIALWLETAIAGITTAAGYQQTLDVDRTMERFLNGESVTDLTTIVTLPGDPGSVAKHSETLDLENPTTTWWQRFDICVTVLGRGATDLKEDTRLIRIMADIHKRLGVELSTYKATDGPYCGGLADAIELTEWSVLMKPDASCTVLVVPVRIKYKVLTRDPYSQPSN